MCLGGASKYWGKTDSPPHDFEVSHAGMHLQSYGEKLGTPKVKKSWQGKFQKIMLKEEKGFSSGKVTWLTGKLRCLYINTCSVGNKEQELEATVLPESSDLVAFLELGGMKAMTGANHC